MAFQPRAAARAHRSFPGASREGGPGAGGRFAMPARKQVLAEVRHAVDRGIDAGVPAITSISFVYAGGAFALGQVTLEAEVRYRGRTLHPRAQVDLTRPERALAGVGRAVGERL